MAPKSNKKKKVVGNTRGVATTSLPSKAKAEREEALLQAQEEAKQAEAAAQQAAAAATQTSTDEAPGTSSEDARLDPEEYARQLEAAELQIFFETHKEKIHREAKKNILKLETEKRTLRALQVGSDLHVHKWIDDATMREIYDMAKVERFIAVDNIASSEVDELTLKIWTLKMTLTGVGFSSKQARAVAEQGITDIDEALMWLGMNYDEGDLPSFLAPGKRTKEQGGSSQSSPAPSGATTPIPGTPSKSKKPDADILKLAISSRNPTPNARSPVPNVSYSSSSEEDTPEPEDLIPRFIKVKTKLWKLRGDDGETTAKGKKKTRKAENTPLPASTPDPTRMAYYEGKISKLESDPLFNKRDAAEAWAEELKKLREKVVQRKKLGLTAHSDDEDDGGVRLDVPQLAVSAGQDAPLKPNGQSSNSASPGLGPLSRSSEDGKVEPADEGLLGGMFEENTVEASDDGKTTVIVRDFGKASEPESQAKKLLEETIRSKFSGAKVRFMDMTKASKNYRYKVTVSGPGVKVPPGVEEYKNGLFNRSFVASYLTSPESSVSTVSIESRTVSQPSAAQGINYISVIAMFVFFPDLRLSLRLGPSWKEFWVELEEEKKKEDDKREMELLKGIRTMLSAKVNDDTDMGVRITPFTPNSKTPTDAEPEEFKPLLDTSSMDSEILKLEWMAKTSTNEYAARQPGRQQLPIYSFREQILKVIDENRISIVCGETGCGKSTNLPVFILEQEMSRGRECKIYVTEPRRISAISLARRVSAELGEDPKALGTRASYIGYSIRLEAKHTPQTKLIYATTGIIMRMLEGGRGELGEITHLVIDEVHERSIESDFLLIILKRLVEESNLKIVLMSATLDTEKFSKYLGDCPVIEVPGRTFPVQTLYLEDAIEATGFVLEDKGGARWNRSEEDDWFDDSLSKSGRANSDVSLLDGYSTRTKDTIRRMDEAEINYDLIVELLSEMSSPHSRYFAYSKAILIFLPGMQEIKKLKDMLESHRLFSTAWVIPMHSSISSEEQESAFIVNPRVQKIVLGTNLCETGITIPDITAVIDGARHKEMRFSEKQQLSRLVETFISKNNAKQRRGRAGRVQEGLCFHLITRERAEYLLSPEQVPEMMRLSLQDLVLRVKLADLGGIQETLSAALDPPTLRNIQRAVDALVEVRALTSADGDLTQLGRQLARLPLDVHLGKLLLLSAVHGCLDFAVTTAAILSNKSPFVVPLGKRLEADRARLEFKTDESDLLTAVNAYTSWRSVIQSRSMSVSEYCHKNFLSHHNLSAIEDIKMQLYVQLGEAGFLPMDSSGWQSLNRARFTYGGTSRRWWFEPPEYLNRYNLNDDLKFGVVAAAFYPKILRLEGKKWCTIANSQRVSVHPSSVCQSFKAPWVSFFHVMQTNKRYNAHEVSRTEDIALALLCGEAEVKLFSGTMLIDNKRISFNFANWRSMIVVKILRSKVRKLTAKLLNPNDPDLPLREDEQRWMDILRHVLTKPSPKVVKK